MRELGYEMSHQNMTTSTTMSGKTSRIASMKNIGIRITTRLTGVAEKEREEYNVSTRVVAW